MFWTEEGRVVGLGVFMVLVALAGCRSAAPRSMKLHEFFDADYARDVHLRPAMCEFVASAEGIPLTRNALGHLLDTGGILAFRDYLVYLGNDNPQLKEPWYCLVMQRQVYEPTDYVLSGPRFWKVVTTGPLEAEGLLSSSEEYTYHDLARIIERTLHRWERADPGIEAAHALNIATYQCFRLRERRPEDKNGN